MQKKCLALMMLVVFALCSVGCGTLSGTAQGVHNDIKNTKTNIDKADAWWKEHMW